MIIVKIYLRISLELLWAVWGQSVQFQMVSCSSYTSQDLQAPSNVVGANYRVLICCTCRFQSSSSVCFVFFCLQVSSASNFCPDTRGRRWSLIQAHFFSCAVGREEHWKLISPACVGSARSVSATMGLPQLTTCVLSQSTLLRLQVALQGNCLKWALVCVYFPGLGHSGSGSQVLHKGTNSVGPVFCAITGLSSSGDKMLGEHTLPTCGLSYCLPHPSCSVSWVCSGSTISGVLCVSSRELISGCNPPGRCQPSRIPGRLVQQLRACSQLDGGCHLWGRDCPFPALAAAYLWWGLGQSAALLWYSLSPLFCEWARSALGQCFSQEISLSLSLFFLSFWLSHSLGCNLMLASSDCPQGIQAGSMPPCSALTCWWQMQASGVLLTGSCCKGRNLWVLFICLFIFPPGYVDL